MRMLAPILGALLIPAAAFAQTEAETRIADAFVQLGMSESKAACYGAIVAQNLEQEQTEKAASIVETASTSIEVREGVMNAGPAYMDAFSAARDGCGK